MSNWSFMLPCMIFIIHWDMQNSMNCLNKFVLKDYQLNDTNQYDQTNKMPSVIHNLILNP